MTTLQRLQALLEKDFDVPAASITPESRLEDLEIDSLRMIEILFSVEEAFRITVPAEQAELKARLTTVQDLAAYIDSLVAEQHPGGAAA